MVPQSALPSHMRDQSQKPSRAELVRGSGVEERLQSSAGQSCGVQHSEHRCEVVAQSWLPREGAAALLEPAWAQGGCSSDQGSAWTQQPHSRPPQMLLPPGEWGDEVWEDPQHLLCSALACDYTLGRWK